MWTMSSRLGARRYLLKPSSRFNFLAAISKRAAMDSYTLNSFSVSVTLIGTPTTLARRMPSLEMKHAFARSIANGRPGPRQEARDYKLRTPKHHAEDHIWPEFFTAAAPLEVLARGP